MKIIDIFSETGSALTANKVRTFLTMLGIVIGIASVIVMLAIGQGAQNSITGQITSLGSNLITISPSIQRGVGTQVSAGRGSARSLTIDDSKAIRSEISGLTAVAPMVSGSFQMIYKSNNTRASVIGTTDSYAIIRSLETSSGDFFTTQQDTNGSKVVVIGVNVLTDLFGDDATADSAIGETVKMNSQLFKIIGILESKTGISSTDDSVLVPITTFQRYLTRDAGYVNTIIVSAENADEMIKIQNNISDLLFVRHKLKDPALLDFSISNMSEMLDTVNQITTMFSLLLGSIAGISLLVGGIGIMNMMLTTVTERMREIGLRKAIGAKQNDISLQFLFEAVALTLIGGIIGIAAGWALSELAGYLLTKFTTTELQPAVSIFAIVLACGVSTLIGIIFGYYPARRAAKLNPIEALRYE